MWQTVKPKALITEADVAQAAGDRASFVASPMPGRVAKVFVKPGDSVKKGQNLVAVESMKMEYFVKATHDAVVGAVKVAEGEAVQMKQELVAFESQKAAAEKA